MTNAIAWKYTFPIEKAEARDGGLFLTGLASGPEVDAQGERMAPSVIFKMANQINNGAAIPLVERLVYRDAHAPDGVMRDLGWINKAWVNENTQLGVEVELDQDNPAAVYLFKQIVERKKKYGMSVGGKVLDYADEFVSNMGKMIRTLKDVVLTEISNTTRPAWTPSFGSVISKAIEDAEKAESQPNGDDQVSDQELGLHQHDDEAPAGGTDQPEAEKADEAAAETVVETAEDTAAKDDAEKADEASAEDAEKAGRKLSTATSSKLLEQYQAFGATLRELGVLEAESTDESAEKATSDDDAETTKTDEGSEPDPLTKALSEIEELRKSQAELSAQLQAALNRPITQVPPVLEKGVVDEFNDLTKGLSASERLRAAMATQTGGR